MCDGGKGQSTTGLAQISKAYGLVNPIRNHTNFGGHRCTEDLPNLGEWSANLTLLDYGRLARNRPLRSP